MEAKLIFVVAGSIHYLFFSVTLDSLFIRNLLRRDVAEKKRVGSTVTVQVKIHQLLYTLLTSIGIGAILAILLMSWPASSEGRIYEGSEEKAHCSLWDNLRLKWPQTILGREKAKCRRKAKPPTQFANVCRLRRQYIDPETGSRMCVYMRQGRDLEDTSVSLSPSLQCQRTYTCRSDD